MVRKLASKARSNSLSSLSANLWVLVRRMLPPSFRVTGWLLLDLSVVLGALFGAISIGAEDYPLLDTLTPLAIVAVLLCTAAIFTSQGLYRSVIRYMGQRPCGTSRRP